MHDIVEVEKLDRTPELMDTLCAVWEGAVRATHDFLPEGEVERIGAMVPQAIAGVPTLLVCTRDGEPVGFLGMDGAFIEMLFVSAACRGQGIGRSLIERAIADYGATEVSVNEQNPQAVGFYERMGFTTYRRTDTDGEGAPYPLLFMRR